MEKLLKNFFLWLAKNKFLNAQAKKRGLKFGAGRFISGETIEQAVTAIQKLSNEGLLTTVDYVGEFISTEEEANAMTDGSIEAIKTFGKHGLNSQLSLKMTSMGLDISDEVVMRNMRRILDCAKENHVFVTIDMEDYNHCQKTMVIFSTLAKEYDHVGTVIQAYLYRSKDDIDAISVFKPNIRLVKGAYKESPEVAYQEKKDIDENFKRIIVQHLTNGNYAAVASHDENIINYVKEYTKENNIERSQFEFQMLYGICLDLQARLVKEGYTVRVYLPYGKDWYGYFMRRMAERPSNIMLVLKGLFK